MKLVQGFTNTQPLWRGTQFGIPQFRLPSIDLRTFTPTPIPTKLRLGHQVEHVFIQNLESHPDYTILAHSLQIKRNKQTIGELDFLVRYKEQLYHIELSCKFYLIDPSITESIHCLVGPNRSDAFFKKIEKTQQKQLPLLYCEECLQQLHLKPDIISLDYTLPDMTGEEVLEEIKEFNQEILVVILSGQQDISTAVKLLKKGAYDYITKDEETKDRLLNTLSHIKKHLNLQKEVAHLRKQLNTQFQFDKSIVGPLMSRTLITCIF